MNINDKLLNIELPHYCGSSDDWGDSDYLESDFFLAYYNNSWVLARLSVEIKANEEISNNTLKKLY